MIRTSRRVEGTPQLRVRKQKPGAGAPKGNQNAKGNPGGSGRPSRYNRDLISVVRLMAVCGASDREIACAIKVSVETLRRWRRERIEFLNGTCVTNEEMAEAARTSLYRRAVGFTYKGERVFVSRGQVIRVQTTEHVIPDVNAAIKILQAYDPAFREKTEVKSTFSWASLIAETDRYLEEKAAKSETPLIQAKPEAQE
jgi:hypothetical protein